MIYCVLNAAIGKIFKFNKRLLDKSLDDIGLKAVRTAPCLRALRVERLHDL